jgi:hypothetical protein
MPGPFAFQGKTFSQNRLLGPAHIARLTWFITDKREYLSRLPEIGEAYRSVMGNTHFPAMTMSR